MTIDAHEIPPGDPRMHAWHRPIPLALVADADPDGFASHPEGTTGIPVGDAHPGAFGFVRANHVHEGVDLYCPEGTTVHAVEDGVVVAVIPFTGPSAEPPSPWWHDTLAVLVEGASGVVVYGEVDIGTGLRVGTRLAAGEAFAHVVRVLRRDKGRPASMLHLELHEPGTRDAYEWTQEGGRPESLLDPTTHLLFARRAGQ
jgi:murein DD-endopeptidase MepM/ murein hydrolase activator NlpD